MRTRSVITKTRPQTTCIAPSWAVRPNDLRVMRENLNRAQGRGAVPYDDAERLHTVINTFEDVTVEREQISELAGGLAEAVESLELFDADTVDVSLDVLNDLELPAGAREQIEDALEKSVRSARTALSIAITEMVADVKKLSEQISEITDARCDE